MKRIVLTGGPCSGKTRMTQRLAERHPAQFVRVPEAATQVYEALQTRWDRLDEPGRRRVQRQIYQLQVEQEERIGRESPQRVLLLDRGTLDGAAYWPDGAEAYWQDLGTSAARELGRYDAVIWMQTSAAIGAYDGDASNICRFENAEAAVEAGRRLVGLWGSHPKFFQIDAYQRFEEKVDAVESLLKGLLRGVEDSR